MPDLWQKRGWWYTPRWRNPLTGQQHERMPLGTQDAAEAEAKWIQFQAGEVAKAGGTRAKAVRAPELPGVGSTSGNVMLSAAITDYLQVRKKNLKPRTRKAYEQYRDLMLREGRLPDRLVSALAPPDGTRALSDLYDRCLKQGVRKHTLWKWIVGLLRPAMRHAAEMRWLPALPAFPDFQSDYEAKGIKDKDLNPDEMAALWRQLPERATLAGLTTHLQLAGTVAAFTGMHSTDLLRFRGAYWRRLGRQWFRVNTKGAERHPPEWFECEPGLQAALETAYCAREWGPDDGVIVEGFNPDAADAPEVEAAWVHAFGQRVLRAATAAKLGLRVSPIWFRHFFAAQMRDRGWPEADTGKVLGNSAGIVAQVYAHIPVRRITERVRASDLSAVLARAFDAAAPRADAPVPVRARAKAPAEAREATGTDGAAASVLQFPVPKKVTNKADAKKGAKHRAPTEVEPQRVLRDFTVTRPQWGWPRPPAERVIDRVTSRAA